MAAETPFGLSFGNYGDPRKYIGQGESPGKKIQEKFAKIQKSPLANVFGIVMAGDGAEPAPSSAPVLNQGIAPPAASQIGISPTSVQTQPPPSPVQGTDTDGDGQVDNFWNIKSPQSSVDVKNRTDFNPLSPDASTQVAVSGNDYQQIPSYGKLQKIASAIFGQG